MELKGLETEIFKLVKDFVLKHFDLEEDHKKDFHYWIDVQFIRDDLFGVVNIADYSFDMSDVFYDMKNDIPKGKILDWNSEAIDIATAGKKFINFTSYCMNNYNMIIEVK